MYDRFNRHINYLRISVTDKCNLRCFYCMPEEGIKLLRHDDILSYEEMLDIVKYAAKKGISKVRLTGGEPLVRRNILQLVRMISNVEAIEDFSMTTNGILLEEYASDLKRAGMHRVNVSLDTLDPEKYSKITRGGDIRKVFKGLETAQKAGLTPIKINMVINDYTEDKDRQNVKDFCEQNGFELRFIKMMNLSRGEFSVVEGGKGGDCASCNRLRLTSNGYLKPCLFNDIAYNVRELGVEEAFRLALENKPKAGTKSSHCSFNRIGG